MSTLQHDELLTQSEILEKETSPPGKEAYSFITSCSYVLSLEHPHGLSYSI
jgi:hypothetical protein